LSFNLQKNNFLGKGEILSFYLSYSSSYLFRKTWGISGVINFYLTSIEILVIIKLKVMYNRKRREKLADLLFDLVKFILTVGVIDSFIACTFKPLYLVTRVICAIVLTIGAYF
jgi:hypothetical protein